ncbi:MAG: sugar ABC transporter permease [Sphaerochaetaceae bacterium]|nr:sugar ABC transporter permease [Sphaerochaetaceae bacterium]
MQNNLKSIERKLGYTFSFPILFLVFIIIGFPSIYTFILSFTNKRIGYPYHFIGIKNYVDIFKNPVYWRVLSNTIIYTFVCIIIKLMLGFAFALLLNENFKGRGFVRVAMLVPWAIPGMVAAHTWRWMYNDQYGIINAILRNIGLIDNPIPWLSDMKLALIAVIIVNIWRGIPFFLFSILGGLQTIDSQLYDAAKVDGAGIVSRFLNVTVPSIAPVLTITTLLSTIWTFNDFDNIWLITGGGPLNASSVISTFTYETAFISNQMGRALAVAISIIPILIGLMFVANKLLSREDK